MFESTHAFATIEAVDENKKLLKLILEPYGTEVGWCRVLKDTFYIIPGHLEDTEFEPKFPYKVGQEVLVGIVRGNHSYEQYIVLGLIE